MDSTVTIENDPGRFDDSPADYDLFRPLAEKLLDRYHTVGAPVPDNLMRLSRGHPVVFLYWESNRIVRKFNVMRMLAEYLFDVAGRYINMDFDYSNDDWYDFPRYYSSGDLISKYGALGAIPSMYMPVEDARVLVRSFVNQFNSAIHDLRFVYHHMTKAGARANAHSLYRGHAFGEDGSMTYEVKEEESVRIHEYVPMYVYEKEELLSNPSDKKAKMCMLISVTSNPNYTEKYKAKLERVANEQTIGKVLTDYRQDLVAIGSARSCRKYEGAFRSPTVPPDVEGLGCPPGTPCMMYRSMPENGVKCDEYDAPLTEDTFYEDDVDHREMVRHALAETGYTRIDCGAAGTYAGYDAFTGLHPDCDVYWTCRNGHDHRFPIESAPNNYTCIYCGDRMPDGYFNGAKKDLEYHISPVAPAYNIVMDMVDSAKKSPCGTYSLVLDNNGYTYRRFSPDPENGTKNPMETSGIPYTPSRKPPTTRFVSYETFREEISDYEHFCGLVANLEIPVFPNSIKAPTPGSSERSNHVEFVQSLEGYGESIDDRDYGAAGPKWDYMNNIDNPMDPKYMAFEKRIYVSYSHEGVAGTVIDCGEISGHSQAYIPANKLYHTESPLNLMKLCNRIVNADEEAKNAISEDWKNGFFSYVQCGYSYTLNVHFFLEYGEAGKDYGDDSQ